MCWLISHRIAENIALDNDPPESFASNYFPNNLIKTSVGCYSTQPVPAGTQCAISRHVHLSRRRDAESIASDNDPQKFIVPNYLPIKSTKLTTCYNSIVPVPAYMAAPGTINAQVNLSRWRDAESIAMDNDPCT